jgi:hypothetical protein
VPVDTPEQGSNPDTYQRDELLAGASVSPWFYALDARRTVGFRANVEGTTTSGSSYPRSELREMQTNGSSVASWDASTGNHYLGIIGAVTHVPTNKPQVVFLQIHGGGDDIVQVRYHNGAIRWNFEGSLQDEVLEANYQLGTVFKAELSISGGTLSVIYNGKTVATRSITGPTAYFKAGAYVQSNLTYDNPGEYGEVQLSQVTVTH